MKNLNKIIEILETSKQEQFFGACYDVNSDSYCALGAIASGLGYSPARRAASCIFEKEFKFGLFNFNRIKSAYDICTENSNYEITCKIQELNDNKKLSYTEIAKKLKEYND